MKTRQKLAAVRKLMQKDRVDGLYVPSVDPHQSEYVPECWKRRHWLSGFTGSAGDLMITQREAGLWTDSRYWLQAGLQLADSGIALMKIGEAGTPSPEEWIARRLRSGQFLGVDPQVVSVSGARRLQQRLAQAGIRIRYLKRNPVDELWEDRPEPSLAPIEIHSSRLAGETAEQKLARVREVMKLHGARAHVLGALDAIAWLFNVRSRDINYTPVVIAYAVVTDRTARLFVDRRKITSRKVARALARVARVEPYENFPAALQDLAARKVPVLLDPQATNQWVAELLAGSGLIEAPSPVFAFKAVKNDTQMAGIRAAHVRDGVAMVKFLKWLEEAVPAGDVTELSAAARLAAFRAEAPEFRDLSFETISGYGSHGAIVHYAADEKSDRTLRPRGLYLIDSGGQYPDGTTDITRTVGLGRPTQREREAFTRVLLGNIRCTRTPFPAGTTGQRIELHARQPLWEAGLDYGHGTGHGVGQYLGVHEGPISLKDVPTVPLEPGNLLSIEPGIYRAGRYGIRVENLALVVRDEKLSDAEHDWYRFDPVTLCPIDLSLVDPGLLGPEDLRWLDAYHLHVYQALRKHLDREHRAWLRQATRSLAKGARRRRSRRSRARR
jgi:Xaa-Pro aminopeptidase